jgi:hypothetical protein
MWRIGYEVNRSQKQTNSVGNSTEIAELIVAQRYTVGYKLYKTTALHKKSETSGDIEFFSAVRCVSLRALRLKSLFNAEIAEIRRGPQRKSTKNVWPVK